MKLMSRTVRVIVTVLAGTWLAACDPTPASVEPTGKVKAVIDRTKTTRETYAVYSWNLVSRDGGPVQEWGAEFHSGDRHRVETPAQRLIADCKAQTGSALSVATGETFEGPAVARAACGINTNKPFVAAEWQGEVGSPFGPADRVRLVDKDNIRTYDVSSAGVIVRSTYAPNKPGAPLSLSASAVSVLPELPAPDLFDKASLSRSYVPDQFKTEPRTAP